MFYDAHFTVDVVNWSRGIWVDGTTQIMDMEDILLSDRLVVGASVMDSLTSAANACGITLAMMGDFLIVAYFNGEIIGQIAVGVGRGGIELAPSCLHSLDRSDAVEEAWCWFCGRIREISDSVTV